MPVSLVVPFLLVVVTLYAYFIRNSSPIGVIPTRCVARMNITSKGMLYWLHGHAMHFCAYVKTPADAGCIIFGHCNASDRCAPWRALHGHASLLVSTIVRALSCAGSGAAEGPAVKDSRAVP